MGRISSLLQSFRRRRAGTAALEFAICAPIMFGMLAVMVDIGNLLRARMTLSAAVASAAEYATLAGASVVGTNVGTVVTSVASTAGLAVSASVSGPACYCPSGSPVTFSTATCGTTCALNSLAPNSYVVITGTYTYTPIAPHLSKIVSTTLTEQATVAVR